MAFYSKMNGHNNPNTDHRGDGSIQDTNTNSYHLRNPYSQTTDDRLNHHDNYPHDSNPDTLARNHHAPRPQGRDASLPSLSSSFAICAARSQPSNQESSTAKRQSLISSSSHMEPQQQKTNLKSSLQMEVDHLQTQLKETNESNFELEASVVALEAELQHTVKTLTEQSSQERSKLEYELRLAQQEAKRWKQFAQQQQHSQQQGRSIVGMSESLKDSSIHSNSTSSFPSTKEPFSGRLLGNPVHLHLPTQTSAEHQKENTGQVASKKSRTDYDNATIRSESPHNLDTSNGKADSTNLGSSNSSFRTNLNVEKPLNRLIRKILEQVQPNVNASITQHNNNPAIAENETAIREVLLSILTENESYLASRSENNKPMPSPDWWNEGRLMEWVMRNSNLGSSDRYWSALLIQSPEARKFVIEQVTSGQIKNGSLHANLVDTQRRKRRDRIRLIGSNGNVKQLQERQEKIRTALKDPWWVFNEAALSLKDARSFGEKASTSSQPFFHEWIKRLSNSRHPTCLEILCILLAEVGGRNGLEGKNRHESNVEIWWELSFPCVAATIQRIAYRKLLRSNQNKTGSLVLKKFDGPNHSDHSRRSRCRIDKVEERMLQLPKINIPLKDSDLNADIYDESRERKQRINENSDKTNRNWGMFEESEDRVFGLALTAWARLLQVASDRQLHIWYADRKGLFWDTSASQEKQPLCSISSVASGGLFMVSLLLDLLDELHFKCWITNDGVGKKNSMSLAEFLSNGSLSHYNRQTNTMNRIGVVPENSCYLNDDEKGDSVSTSTIPEWYDAAIAVLTQIGRTEKGMEVLRSRIPDNRQSDWMGNALDVGVRHMHTFALHLDDVNSRHGSIVRLGECTCGDRDMKSYGLQRHFIEDNTHVARLRRGVESWVRLWHQVLIFVQSKETISFRSLVLEQREWYSSTCAILLASEEIRPEIKSMIRWQLDELIMDEEDFQESKHSNR